MKKYTVVYLLAYLSLGIVVSVFAELLKLEGSAAFGTAAALGAAFIAAHVFVRDHERGPTLVEQRSFARQVIGTTWGIALLVAAVLLFAVLPWSKARLTFQVLQMPVVREVALPVLVVVTIVDYLVIRWAFGWYGRRRAEAGRVALPVPAATRRLS